MQVLLLIRDDFWMAVSRLMRELEVPLLEGRNSAAVDTFPRHHAEKVLAAFGRAYGVLPQGNQVLSKETTRFIQESIAGLEENQRVNCARLALFAELMKGKPWTSASLRKQGGAKGAAVTFLEEMFNSPNAPPKNRFHQKAVRKVLRELLPATGIIKGRMRSYDELFAASGYRDHEDFDDLLRILDSVIRIITPTDPISLDSGGEDSSNSSSRIRFFQLTHDYLVPAIRDWLALTQRQSRQGRAELILEERASAWSDRPEKRQLPTILEMISILLWTSWSRWSTTQRQMMRAATRSFGIRAAFTFALIAVVSLVGLQVQRSVTASRQQARLTSRIEQLLIADFAEVPRLTDSLKQEPPDLLRQLESIADDANGPPADRLRAEFVLAGSSRPYAMKLAQRGLTANVDEVPLIGHRLHAVAGASSGLKEILSDSLWGKAFSGEVPPKSILRLASMLALLDPSSPQWSEVAPTVVNAMLTEEVLHLDQWAENLRPAAAALLPELRARNQQSTKLASDHTLLARILARYADAELLADLLLNATPAQFAFFAGPALHNPQATGSLAEILLAKLRETSATEPDKLLNGIVVLLRLGQYANATEYLKLSANPTARTMFIIESRSLGILPETLLEAYQYCSDGPARQALLLALDFQEDRDFGPRTKTIVKTLLQELLYKADNASERSAAQYLLGRLGELPPLSSGISIHDRSSPGNPGSWWVNSQGQYFTTIQGPLSVQVGSPTSEVGRTDGDLGQQVVQIEHSFSVGLHEVTVEQYRRFVPNAQLLSIESEHPQLPINNVSMVNALKYCRWLSEQEQIAEEEMCYPPIDQIREEHIHLSPEQLRKTGYRLLRECEWEFACRAGSQTLWHFGDRPEYAPHFAWYGHNTYSYVKPSASRLPNGLGLFDTCGNVAEWCQPHHHGSLFLRGGYYKLLEHGIRSASRHKLSSTGYSFTGFRLGRTLPANWP